tara:strand:- start:7907 stop:8329 length:423 start_codon:yes stop_codon:yes gene_type:complete
MDGCLAQSGELQGKIRALRFAVVLTRGFGITGLEVFDDLRTDACAFDLYDPPRTRVADRRRKIHSQSEPIQNGIIDRVRFEMPDVAPPSEDVIKRVTVIVCKFHHVGLHHFLTWVSIDAGSDTVRRRAGSDPFSPSSEGL